jgi:hypothetical protein
VISIRNAANEERVAGMVLSETHFSIRVGTDGWGAGIAYRAPRSISRDGQRVIIRDYVLGARLASLILVFLCVTIRRVSK